MHSPIFGTGLTTSAFELALLTFKNAVHVKLSLNAPVVAELLRTMLTARSIERTIYVTHCTHHMSTNKLDQGRVAIEFNLTDN